MRVWIGCLASHNNGRLHGEWFDVSTDVDENEANVAKVLRSSPYPNVTRMDGETGETYATAEEAFCADYDGPKGLADALGEYPTAAQLTAAAEIEETVLASFDDEEKADAVISAMLDGVRNIETIDAQDWVSDHFAGEADSLADFAEQLIEEQGLLADVPSELARYFDYESYGRDLELGGDVSTARAGGGLLVFWNR